MNATHPSRSAILNAASFYSSIGHAVIPIQRAVIGNDRSGKTPCVPWKSFQSHRPTASELNSMLVTGCNIGIVTGAISNCVVVDCDSQEAADWCRSNLDATPRQTKTGSGGIHLWFKHPGFRVANGIKLQGLDLDVRGDGGYVVAPPSLHWSGNRYVQLGDWQAPLPEFKVEWVVEDTPLHPQSKPVVVLDDDVDFMRQRARKYIATIFSISGHGGDRKLFRAACALVQKFDLPLEVALEELRIWNETNAVPPWNDTRLVYKVSQASKMKGT